MKGRKEQTIRSKVDTEGKKTNNISEVNLYMDLYYLATTESRLLIKQATRGPET